MKDNILYRYTGGFKTVKRRAPPYTEQECHHGDTNVGMWLLQDRQSKRNWFPQEEWKQLQIPGWVWNTDGAQDGWSVTLSAK